MSFDRPWLLLLALLPLAAYARRPRRVGRTLQLGAALVLAAAVAGPRTGGAPVPTVLALDRSASIDGAARATEDAWAARLRGPACARPSCPVIDFAADVAAVSAGSPDLAVGGGATDLGRGLEAAVDAAPRGGRVVVLSDGVETAGDAGTALAAARLRGVEIDAVALADPGRRDAAVTRVDAPAAVHLGDTVPLLVTIHSSVVGHATLAVSRDGARDVPEQIALHRGDNALTLSYVARARGWHSFLARVRLGGDAVPQNDALAAVVAVGASPRVLAAARAGSSVLSRSLRLSGVRIANAPLPTRAAAYAHYDGVVLDDVAAASLTAAQIAALTSAVRLGGTGLLLAGGPHSLSLGGYAGSPLDAILPVTSRAPGNLQRRDLALELVVDRSGSMADRSGSVRKIAMAQRAALAATDFAAAHRDELGVVDFDIAPHVAVPLARISPSTRGAVAARIAAVSAAGGTDIYLALRRGLEQIAGSHAAKRHLVLLSDGISQPHDYTTLLARLRRAHVTVAAVALGASADVELLRSIADATGGNFYATSNARALPRIFTREARLSAAPTRLTGSLRVAPVASSPVVRSLVGRRLPRLTGVAATDAKPTAQVDLLTGHGARTVPALAQWQVGTGRVVVWTSSAGAPWAARWAGERALWNDAARWVARPASGAAVTASATAGAPGTVSLDASALGPVSATALPATLAGRRVRLVESGPALYTAQLAALRPGIAPVRVTLPGARAVQRPVAVPYPAEYRPPLDELGSLGSIVAAAGGRLFSPSASRVLAGTRHDLTLALVLLGLALYGAGVAAGMLSSQARSARPRPRAAGRAAARP